MFFSTTIEAAHYDAPLPQLAYPPLRSDAFLRARRGLPLLRSHAFLRDAILPLRRLPLLQSTIDALPLCQ